MRTASSGKRPSRSSHNELFTQKIKDIIDSVNADPSTKSKVRALQGEISWFTPDQADVFGRVLIADVGGTRRKLQSYSCGNNVVLCGVSVSPSAISFDIGTDTAFGANLSFCTSYSPTTCSGGSYGGGSATYSWTSTNASLTPIVGSSSSYSAELYGQGVGTGGASVYVSAGSCGMGGSGQATVLGPDHVAVIVDNGGFPSDCPTTGIYVRQMQMQVVDTNGTPIGTIFSTKEAFSPNNILNTCGNGLPVPSSCAAEDAGGSFIDTMDVSGNFCTSGIKQSSGCGYSLTSTWSMCSNGFTNNIWTSPRTTLSNTVEVNGSQTSFKKGTQFH